MSVSDLARERRVSKQVISKNLKRWAAAGRVVSTKREGKATMIRVAEYDAARGEIGDLARQMGEAAKKGALLDSPSPDGAGDAPIYTYEQARAKQYEADIKEIELRKLRGELVEVAALQGAATAAAEAMLRAIDQLPARAEELAVAAKMPLAACRQFLKTAARDLRSRAADVFSGLASRAMTPDEQAHDETD